MNPSIPVDIFFGYKSIPENRQLPSYLVKYELVVNTNNYTKRNRRGQNPNSTWKKPDREPPNNWIQNQKMNQDEGEKLCSQYRSILNKLSESNLEELSDELVNLRITDKEDLLKLADILFQKAISESKYCSMYAKLTKYLASYYIEVDQQKVFFREILINKCQKMFTEAISQDNELETDNIDSIFKFKSQVIGCIIYVGELYNQELLTDRIMYSCFKAIFSKVSLKKVYIIEILCSLIKTVGPRFGKKCPTEFENCLKTINDIKNETANKKDKFALMDILDLYKKKT